MKANSVLMAAVASILAASAAHAAEVLVTTNISVSETWTANNTYNLQNQIYVLPGATLTIEAGTVVASTTNIGGSLAVCKGAQIFVNGTQSQPVIMTSTADVATWTGGNPKTGIWREAANEWGNLTIMGGAYISEDAIAGNVPTPNASNVGAMEGLVAAFPGDTKVLYGGGNDDDDSGSVTYLSLRYGGKVVGLGNELNGLSLGGIGRNTEVNHIDIMNNVDDGIEIWGGTVNLKYLNIWNIGDDCFDVDQGWRGKAQYGLLVQGYSVNAAQGSGVGDNIFETDGAEKADCQPVTTSTIYNFTVIGQPAPGAGDHATAWRANARVQYRNCVFMDLGDRLVSFDNTDGEGDGGYGLNGTLTWAQHWTTPYTATSTVNAPANPALFYTVQTTGNLCEITDSVMFRNLSSAAYTEANTVGVFAPANNNVQVASVLDADAPIRSITRGPAVLKGGMTMLPVIGLDPRPANDALTSVAAAPIDGFFTPAQYRGAFDPKQQSWLCDWTASYAFGYTTACEPGRAFCFGDGSGTACPCGNNSVLGSGQGCLSSLGNGAILNATGISSITDDRLTLSGVGMPNSSALFFQGTAQQAGGLGGVFGDGLRCAAGAVIRLKTTFNTGGGSSYPGVGDPKVSIKGLVSTPGSRNYQIWYRNAAAFCTASTFNLSNGYQIVWNP